MTGAGKHSWDNDAVIMRGEISRISLAINQQITALNLSALELQAAAEDILALRTGDTDVASAAGILSNRVVKDLKQSVAQVISIRQQLETYMGRL